MEKAMPKNVCPRCSSENIKIISYMGVDCIICSNCGFDERNYYEVYPEHKTNQKMKGSFSPYKVGGSGRARK